jgi:hypothetical protein
MLRTRDKWPCQATTYERHELPPLHLTPVAAEEMPRDYQFSAHTASVCCIAMGARERRQVWVLAVSKFSHTQGQFLPKSNAWSGLVSWSLPPSRADVRSIAPYERSRALPGSLSRRAAWRQAAKRPRVYAASSKPPDIVAVGSPLNDREWLNRGALAGPSRTLRIEARD